MTPEMKASERRVADQKSSLVTSEEGKLRSCRRRSRRTAGKLKEDQQLKEEEFTTDPGGPVDCRQMQESAAKIVTPERDSAGERRKE